jgi:hypothetical protein
MGMHGRQKDRDKSPLPVCHLSEQGQPLSISWPLERPTVRAKKNRQTGEEHRTLAEPLFEWV